MHGTHTPDLIRPDPASGKGGAARVGIGIGALARGGKHGADFDRMVRIIVGFGCRG